LHFIKTKKIPLKFIRFFKQAKEAREEADYGLLKKFSKKETEKIIETAEEFIKLVSDKFEV
jgi:uncharacterized protein (UPF0332 family)